MGWTKCRAYIADTLLVTLLGELCQIIVVKHCYVFANNVKLCTNACFFVLLSLFLCQIESYFIDYQDE